MIRHTTKHQKMGWVLFLMYLALLVYFLFFAESFGRTDPKTRGYSYNLVPFKEISRFWIYREKLGIRAMMLNIVGNIVMFFPWGFGLPLLWKKRQSVLSSLLSCALLPVFIETVQLFIERSVDIDDLILNFAGGMIGAAGYFLIRKRIPDIEQLAR